MTNDTIPAFTNSLLFDSDVKETSAIKFGLFVKTREMKQLEKSLRDVMVMSSEKRTEWMENNEVPINQMLEDFMNDSALALDGLQLDPEALQMSMEYVSILRDVMTTMRSIMDDSRILNS